MLREFDGTATCPLFDVQLFNVTSATSRISIMHANATHWLSTAGRSREAAWVAMHREAAKEGRPTSLGLTASTKEECHPGKLPEELRPRIIFACSPQYAVNFNPPMHYLVQFWKANRLDHLCPAFGMTRDDVGDWLMRALVHYPDPAFVENDCKAWDATVSVQGLSVEMDWCRFFTDASPEWLDLYALQYTRNARSALGAMSYSRVGGRISGVGNTSFGNTLLNLCMHKTAAGDTPCHMLALGDDIIVVCAREDAASLCTRFEQNLTRWGFKPKAKWTTRRELAEFCSSYIAKTTCGRLTLVPKTGKQLLKAVRAYDYAHYSAISAGIMSSSPDPLLRLLWSKLPTPDQAAASAANPYTIGAGSRLASWESVEARYGPVTDIPVFVGDWPRGASQTLDAIFDADFPGLAGPFSAHAFPPRVAPRKSKPGPTPDPRTVPCFSGQMEDVDWVSIELHMHS